MLKRLAFVVLFCSLAVRAATIPLLDEPVVIDGKMDEAVWGKALSVDAFQQPEVTSAPLTRKTSAKIFATRDAVYIGIVCQEPDMASLARGNFPHDSAIWDSDTVEVFLDPSGHGQEYYQFALSSGNTRWDNYFIEAGNNSLEYSSPWESAISYDKDKWTAEIRIPYAALFYTGQEQWNSNWRINIGRVRPASKEVSSWTKTHHGFHEPSNFVKVGGFPVRPAADFIFPARLAAGVESVAPTVKGSLVLNLSAAEAGKCQIELSGPGLAGQVRHEVLLNKDDNRVEIPRADFTKLGNSFVECRIFQAGSKTPAAVRLMPLAVAYTPVKINITEPFYRNTFYPDENSGRIGGVVNCRTSANAALRLTLEGAGLKDSMEFRSVKPEQPFEFAADGMKPGQATLTATLIDADGKILAQSSVAISKAIAPAKGNQVRIDRHLRMVVNGKPVFPLGWYGSYFMVSRQLKEEYPAHADFGTYCYRDNVGLETTRHCRSEIARSKTDVDISDRYKEVLTSRVEQNRGNDFWCYYLADEPECTGISPVFLQSAYSHLMALDADHPVMIISREPGRYVQCADILNPHPYLGAMVNENGERIMRPHKIIRNMCRETLEAGQNRKMLMLTPGVFSYGFQNRSADYPTFEEANCMFWTAIAEGCKGFTPYIYYEVFSRPDLRLGVPFIYEVIEELSPYLLTEEAPLPFKITPKKTEDTVSARVLRHNQSLLVIVVNLEKTPQKLSLQIDNLPEKLHVIRENRMISSAGNRIDLELAPFQVLLLSDAKPDEKRVTLNELRTQIENANRERNRPGNLLYGRGREIDVTIFGKYSDFLAGPMYVQTTLFDGVRDNLAAAQYHRSSPDKLFGIELGFRTFVPEFRYAKIFGAELEKFEFHIWKFGEWEKLNPKVISAGKYEQVLDFGKLCRTVKMKVTCPDAGGQEELYELELYTEI